MRGALVYPQGSIYNQRTAVIFPTQQTALEPNEVIKVHIPLECVKPRRNANPSSIVGFKSSGFPELRCTVKEEKPYREGINYAEEQEIELICIGRSLFGSYTDRVLCPSHCPVRIERLGSQIVLAMNTQLSALEKEEYYDFKERTGNPDRARGKPWPSGPQCLSGRRPVSGIQPQSQI